MSWCPGVYPLDKYFGVLAALMMTGGDLKKVRRRYADDEAAARREASRKKREEKLSELSEPLAWRRYTELSYVFLMNELF